MIGSDETKTFHKVLTIDRLEPSELNILEDKTRYSKTECEDLLSRIDIGNSSTGGLKLITICYGIIGFVKFTGPYYMVLITKTKHIGSVVGHDIYTITKSEMITLPNSTNDSKLCNSKNENRYKKLFCKLDLTKDFYFSYSYCIMYNVQKNFGGGEMGPISYDSMFVWNEFLTRGIRSILKSTLWTVALVYGFFKQVRFSTYEKDFMLTLISRRSRYFAGTRYLKRGVSEKGRVANEVETEQIVFQILPQGRSNEIASVVQHRGSIPLFWSQQPSRLNLKPAIILSKKDPQFEATNLHFKDLINRYGNPIIILNLIKKNEKKPRESILRSEFINAIDTINRNLSDDDYLRFLHWDLNELCRREGKEVLRLLGRVATYSLSSTGLFYGQITPYLDHQDNLEWKKNNNDYMSKPCKFQKGIVRTNCIDCLDRTNVAQYAFGLAALGHQLKTLDLIYRPKIDLDDPLADDLMTLYEEMGDTLALQYGGSAAHNKIFSIRRGQWKAATQSQELFRIFHRYVSNVYLDPEKQNGINLFLGYFQPESGKPEVWELDLEQKSNKTKRKNWFSNENSSSHYKRSFSDNGILCESHTDAELTPSQTSILDSKTDESTWTNFFNLEMLSSSRNSFDEDSLDSSFGYTLNGMDLIPLIEKQSNGIRDVWNASTEFSSRFKHWVLYGQTLSHIMTSWTPY